MALTFGTKLGPYEIHSSIGAGGMGEVYRARDTRLGRSVAMEIELGWLGWSYLRDMSRDGKKILFEEEADGGGANYTVFLATPTARRQCGSAKA